MCLARLQTPRQRRSVQNDCLRKLFKLRSSPNLMGKLIWYLQSLAAVIYWNKQLQKSNARHKVLQYLSKFLLQKSRPVIIHVLAFRKTKLYLNHCSCILLFQILLVVLQFEEPKWTRTTKLGLTIFRTVYIQKFRVSV